MMRLTVHGFEICGVASSISEGDIFICSCSAQLTFFKIDLISKEVSCAEHKYMNMSPSLIKLATPLHDTLNFGVFIVIIYIGEINLQNSYAVSRLVDHLIDIQKTEYTIEYTSPYTTRVWPFEYLNHRKYNVLKII